MPQLWRVVDGWLLENISTLPMMTAPLKSEDEKEPQPSLYSAHLHQTQTEDNTEVEAPTNNPATQMNSKTDGEDYGGPELSSSPDPNSYIQPNGDRKASGSEIKHLSYFGPEMGDSDEDWIPHGSGVNRDKKRNTAKKSLSCSECGKKFHYQKWLQRHLRQHSASEKSSEVKQNVTSQKRVQTRIKTGCRLKCDACDKTDHQKADLKKCFRVHKGKTPFSCDECGHKCSRKVDIERHMRTHTGEKLFGCDECGYRCGGKVDFERHMRTHTGEKPFGCNECGHRFSRKADFKRHMRTHTGEKPFGCDECGHRCSRKSGLKRHMRIHTGEKPFRCDECGHGFIHKYFLKEHMRVHTGGKPFDNNQVTTHNTHIMQHYTNMNTNLYNTAHSKYKHTKTYILLPQYTQHKLPHGIVFKRKDE